MKEDSGVKEQYSRMSIFERIYQHCTTHEQTAFTLNHHHTTTFDNSRLPKNIPRSNSFLIKQHRYMIGGCNRRGFQFFEQLRFKTLQLFVPNSKRLGGYTQ